MADWMAFNVAEYVSNTLHLTARQHGGYILLICAAWANKGVLFSTDEGLRTVAKLTEKEWRQDGEVLKGFLTRRGDVWVHERVEFEWRKAHDLMSAKSKAGKEGAIKRWHGRANSGAMAEPVPAQRQVDAQIQEERQEQSVTTNLPDRSKTRASAQLSERRPLMAEHLPADWFPSDEDIAWAAKARPDLVGIYLNVETERFHNHAKANNRMAHNWAPAWRNWVSKAAAPKIASPGTNGAAGPPLPTDPWEQRLSSYAGPRSFWSPMWGPRPETGHCHAPADILARWRERQPKGDT